MARTKICSKSGKVGFYSKVDAHIKANSAGGWYGNQMGVYFCSDCRLYHTTRIGEREDDSDT